MGDLGINSLEANELPLSLLGQHQLAERIWNSISWQMVSVVSPGFCLRTHIKLAKTSNGLI